MGLFSFCKADSGDNFGYGDKVKYKSPRGKEHDIVGFYDGYGRIGGVDVNYLLAIDNRQYILKQAHLKPTMYKNEYKRMFYDRNIEDEFFYENNDNEKMVDAIRTIGIDYHFDCQTGEGATFDSILPYPLKIVSLECEMEYSELRPSCDDPTQGCGTYNIYKGEFLGYCENCGAECWTENEGFVDSDYNFCCNACHNEYYENLDEEEK